MFWVIALSHLLFSAEIKCQNYWAGVHVPNFLKSEFGVNELCHDEEFNRIYSKNCKKGCELFSEIKTAKLEINYAGPGTPGSQVCLAAGGVAQFYYLVPYDKKKRAPASPISSQGVHVCFKGDQVISTSMAFEAWQQAQNK